MLYRIAKPTISIGVYSKIATKRLFYDYGYNQKTTSVTGNHEYKETFKIR